MTDFVDFIADLNNRAMSQLQEMISFHREKDGVWPDYCWYTVEDEMRDGALYFKVICEVGPKPPQDVFAWNSGWLNWVEKNGGIVTPDGQILNMPPDEPYDPIHLGC